MCDDWRWARKTPYRLFRGHGGLERRGPRSLVDIAIKLVADRLGDLETEHLKMLPRPLVQQLWEYAQKRGLSLHAWKLLSARLLEDEDAEEIPLGRWRFRQQIEEPASPLEVYTKPLTCSPDFTFITYLSISSPASRTFSANEYLALADMKNLGVLEIIGSLDSVDGGAVPEVNDRLVRGWAMKSDPFPLLRILRLWGYRTVSEYSLDFVSGFPSLVIFEVAAVDYNARHLDSISAKHGWRFTWRSWGYTNSMGKYRNLLVSGDRSYNTTAETRAEDILGLRCDDDTELLKLENRPDPEGADELHNGWNKKPAGPEMTHRRSFVPMDPFLSFESWGFYLFSCIGALVRDKDLRRQGMDTGKQASLGDQALPCRPLACLQLGMRKPPQPYQHRRENEMKYLTFARRHLPPKVELQPNPLLVKTAAENAESQIIPQRSMRKRRKLQAVGDVLKSLAMNEEQG